MNPYAKAALFVIRLAACGLIFLGFALCSGDIILYLAHRPFSKPLSLALKASPALPGAALFWKARDLAIKLTKDLE